MSEQQKTTKCPKCQEEIIAGAQKCKHCGSDLRVWWKRHKILTGIGIFFVLVIISAAFSSGDKENGASSAPEQAQTTKETPVKLSGIKISASQLYAAYLRMKSRLMTCTRIKYLRSVVLFRLLEKTLWTILMSF